MEKGQQVAHRLGVSAEVDTMRDAAVFDDRLPERRVLWEADEADGMAVLNETVAKLLKMFEGPGTDRQDSAAGVDENERLGLKGGEICVEFGDPAADFRFTDAFGSGRRRRGRRKQFYAGNGNGFDGGSQIEKLVRHVAVGVIKDGSRQERTAVETFLGVGVEANANRRAGEKRENAAEAGEEFAVDDDVSAQGAQRSQGRKKAENHAGERAVVESNYVFGGDKAQDLDGFAIARKKQKVKRRARILLFEVRKHRRSQNLRAHFRQKKDEDSPGRAGCDRAGQEAVEGGKDGANRRSEKAIHEAIETNIHEGRHAPLMQTAQSQRRLWRSHASVEKECLNDGTLRGKPGRLHPPPDLPLIP